MVRMTASCYQDCHRLNRFADKSADRLADSAELPLFKEDLDIYFFASQRVKDGSEENLFRILPNAFLNNDPLNHVETKDILGNTEKVVFDIIFLTLKPQNLC